MQQVLLEPRHVLIGDRVAGMEMHEVAEQPADGVAQLAVGLDRGLEDFRPDPQVVGIVRRAHPHAQDVGAGRLDHVLRRHRVAERLRHLAPVLVEREAVGQHDVERRDAAGAAAFEQRGVKPAAVLVGALEIHHGVVAAVLPAADAGEGRKALRVLQREGVGRAGVEPDVEDVVDLLPVLARRARRESARGRRPRTRRRRPRRRRPRRCADRRARPAGFRRCRRPSRARTRRSARPRRAGARSPSRAGPRSCRECGSRPAAAPSG